MILSVLCVDNVNCFNQYESLGQLCNDPRAKAAVLAEMDAAGREAGVSYISGFLS